MEFKTGAAGEEYKADKPWLDTYYQYRVPIVIEAENAGWNIIPIDERAITAAINRLEELQYDPLYFAYNYLKVMEVGPDGSEKELGDKAGFFLLPAGEELFDEKKVGE